MQDAHAGKMIRRRGNHFGRRRIGMLGLAGSFAVAACVIGWISPDRLHAQSADVTYADLAPVLTARCVMCHGSASPAAGLRLDSLAGLLAGSAKGPVAKSGDPAGSELIRRLKGTSMPRMPMTGPPFLSDAETAQFERWIAAGMPAGGASNTASPAPPASSSAPAAVRPAPGQPVTFAHVAPILGSRCVKCHMDNGLMGAPPEGLRLTSYATTVSSGERARIVPGNPLASQFYRSIVGHARPRMPRDGPPYLSDDEIRLIADWIRDGARDEKGTPASNPTGARVRLNGTLGPGWTLDGLQLVIRGSTRIDKSPGPGDYVEVRGTVRSDGQIDVERLRRR